MIKLTSFLHERFAIPTTVFGASRRGVIRSATEEVFNALAPIDDTTALRLGIDALSLPDGPAVAFLEARRRPAQEEPGLELVAVARSRDRLYVSTDNGYSLVRKYARASIAGYIKCSFTLDSGERILRTDEGEMYHFDSDERLMTVHNTGRWPWHGSQGIGQSASGAVLYAEYAPINNSKDTQPIHVWRYWPHEGNWHRVLNIEAGVRGKGQIRHFHVCAPNPANCGQWILSSGDVASQCRLWLSGDDGETWEEINSAGVDIPQIPAKFRRQIFRFTQFSNLSNGDVIWGTDDLLGLGRAALIRMSNASGKPTFHFLGWLGDNCVRNIISCGSDRFLLISESKNPALTVDLFLYDHQSGSISRVMLPNLRHKRCPVTASLGSSHFVDGCAFIPSLGNVFTCDKRGLLRIRISGPHNLE